MPLARRSWSSIVSPPVIPGWCASTGAGTALIRQVIGGKIFRYPWSAHTPARSGHNASLWRGMELISPARPAANAGDSIVAVGGSKEDGSAGCTIDPAGLDAHSSGRSKRYGTVGIAFRARR